MLRSLTSLLAFVFLASAALPAQVGRVTLVSAHVEVGDTSDHVDLAWRTGPKDVVGAATATIYSTAGVKLLNQPVRWTSSDTTIATVTGTRGTGALRSKGYGMAIITATPTTKNTGGVSATIPVCVYDRLIPIGQLFIDNPLGTVGLGQSVQLTAHSNTFGLAPQPCLHWDLNDPQYATISRHGLLTGKKLVSGETLRVTAWLGFNHP